MLHPFYRHLVNTDLSLEDYGYFDVNNVSSLISEFMEETSFQGISVSEASSQQHRIQLISLSLSLSLTSPSLPCREGLALIAMEQEWV